MLETQHLRYGADLYLDLAHLSASEGRFDEAEGHLARAIQQASAAPSPAFGVLLHYNRGHLAARRGCWDHAIAELEQSLLLLARDDVRLPADEGRTRLELAAAYAARHARGDVARQRRELRAVRALFERLGASGYLERLRRPRGQRSEQGQRSVARTGAQAPRNAQG